MSPQKAKEKERQARVAGLTPDASYRPCDRFVWLEKHPRAPSWWIDQTTAGDDANRGIRCPGARCVQKGTSNPKGDQKSKKGNKNCTNGGLCKECCDAYQRGGFLQSCGHAPHNYTKKLENVRTHRSMTNIEIDPYILRRIPNPLSTHRTFPESPGQRTSPSSHQEQPRRAQYPHITHPRVPSSPHQLTLKTHVRRISCISR